MSKNRVSMKAAVALLLGLGLVGMGLTSCSTTATTSDMCAYTQGNGQNNNDANVKEIYLPGSKVNPGDGEIVRFFPCNMRNIRMVPGSTDMYANGNKVGSIKARTSEGTEVSADVVMTWTLNEDKDVLKNVFIPLCNKYNCASESSDTRNDNFSTDGWSKGLLGENAIPTLESATLLSMTKFDDSIWTDASKQQQLETDISSAFMTKFHTYTGSTKDMFCASGESSGWTGEPGKSPFNCGSVRVTIEKIAPVDTSILDLQAREALANKAKVVNQAELEAAKAKYGSHAEEVLGDLDRIKACKDAGLSICSTGGMSVGTPQLTK